MDSDTALNPVKEGVDPVTAAAMPQMNCPLNARNAPNSSGTVVQLWLSNKGRDMNSEQETKAGRGFFQLCLARADEIVRVGLGANELFAYVVLAGGVNSRLPLARASTHGIKSVVDRTGMSRQSAANALQKLQQHGFLEALAPAATASRTEPRWSVDKAAPCDLAVSQRFLAPMERGLATGKSAARLGDLFMRAKNTAEISVEQARIDALALFLHLHAHQDFGRYGGVDPACVATYFGPAEDDGAGVEHIVDAARDGWTLVTEQAARHLPGLSDTFLSTALPSSPIWKGPALAVRGAHALKILRDQKLIYGAYVLWESDPIVGPPSNRPSPLVTLYIKGSWAPELEPFLQYRVNDAVLATGTRKGADAYRASLGTAADWEGTGRHMYLLPNGYVNSAKLIKQIRARWWAESQDTINGLVQDQLRVEDWTERLEVFRTDCMPSREDVL
ncbi:MAG: hypothetical protein ACYC0T_07540 [Ramlibacter sp.]